EADRIPRFGAGDSAFLVVGAAVPSFQKAPQVNHLAFHAHLVTLGLCEGSERPDEEEEGRDCANGTSDSNSHSGLSFSVAPGTIPEERTPKRAGPRQLLFLRVERRFHRAGQVRCLAFAPVVEKEDAGFLAGHVMMDGDDVDAMGTKAF